MARGVTWGHPVVSETSSLSVSSSPGSAGMPLPILFGRKLLSVPRVNGEWCSPESPRMNKHLERAGRAHRGTLWSRVTYTDPSLFLFDLFMVFVSRAVEKKKRPSPHRRIHIQSEGPASEWAAAAWLGEGPRDPLCARRKRIWKAQRTSLFHVYVSSLFVISTRHGGAKCCLPFDFLKRPLQTKAARRCSRPINLMDPMHLL